MKIELFILGSVYAAVATLLTFYNFRRSPNKRDKKNRDIVFTAVTIFGAGATIDGMAVGAVFFRTFGFPTPRMTELIGHVMMVFGAGLFFYFSWRTRRAFVSSLRKRAPVRDEAELKRLKQVSPFYLLGVVIVLLIAVETAVSKELVSGFPLKVLSGAAYIFVAIFLLRSLVDWNALDNYVNKKRGEHRYSSIRMAITVAALSYVLHFIYVLGIYKDYSGAGYFICLMIATTFWIASTFDIANGRV